MSARSIPATRRRYGWLIRVWVIVGAVVIVTAVASYRVGIGVKDPAGSIFRLRLLTALGIFALLALVDAAVGIGRQRWTVAGVAGVLRRRWPWRRLGCALAGLLAYYIVYLCYHNLKSWDVFNRPRDLSLLSFDRLLFFGHTPAIVLHDLLGQHLAAYALVVVYESFGYLVTFAVVASVVFSRRARDGYVFLASAIWVWILGVASYYLIPSLGPFAADPAAFAGLPHTIVTSTQAEYLAQRDQLLHPAAPDGFAQISAFASLHVGFTCVILLMCRSYGLRRATAVLTGYLLLTMIATIYLGWHYVSDDLAGLVIGFVAVALGHLTIYPTGPPLGPIAPVPGGSQGRELPVA